MTSKEFIYIFLDLKKAKLTRACVLNASSHDSVSEKLKMSIHFSVGGESMCTEKACGCEYNGERHAAGASFDAADGCNKCSCT